MMYEGGDFGYVGGDMDTGGYMGGDMTGPTFGGQEMGYMGDGMGHTGWNSALGGGYSVLGGGYDNFNSGQEDIGGNVNVEQNCNGDVVYTAGDGDNNVDDVEEEVGEEHSEAVDDNNDDDDEEEDDDEDEDDEDDKEPKMKLKKIKQSKGQQKGKKQEKKPGGAKHSDKTPKPSKPHPQSHGVPESKRYHQDKAPIKLKPVRNTSKLPTGSDGLPQFERYHKDEPYYHPVRPTTVTPKPTTHTVTVVEQQTKSTTVQGKSNCCKLCIVALVAFSIPLVLAGIGVAIFLALT